MSLFASDLDGTLKLWQQEYAPEDLQLLRELGEQGIVRAIATGRNLLFAKKVIPSDFPIDYLIFSSGAGIVRWSDQQLVFKETIAPKATEAMIDTLQQLELNFMVHLAIPEEHRFFYRQNKESASSDYLRRLDNNRAFARPLDPDIAPFPATQALAIIRENEARLAEVAAALPYLKVIRTTSPLDPRYTWIEIFSSSVSKGAAVQRLCERFDLSLDDTFGIGNDYNDTDLLEATGESWVMASAPAPMRARYRCCPADQGVAHAVRSWLDRRQG
ncbi:MAG: HAD family hydrolase [Desulfobulbus sp.]|jgi:HAD superfamily hydrolase (TIGR01484 family)